MTRARRHLMYGWMTALATLGTVAVWHSRRKPLEQPIAFSHRVHVVQNKIDCAYCHEHFRRHAVAAKWKWQVYLESLKLAEEGQVNTGSLMRRLMDDPEMKARAKEVSSLVQKIPSDLIALPSERRRTRLRVGHLEKISILRDAAAFFSKELEAQIQVYADHEPERYDPLKRAANAKPYRPAVFVE